MSKLNYGKIRQGDLCIVYTIQAQPWFPEYTRFVVCGLCFIWCWVQLVTLVAKDILTHARVGNRSYYNSYYYSCTKSKLF